MATGGVFGAVGGAISPNTARDVFQTRRQEAHARADMATAQAANAKQNIQFESVRAADSHILAAKQAQNYDRLNEQSRAEIRKMNDEHAQFLMDNFGIAPDLTLEGNGQEVHDQANGALHTLAGENGGQIPPVVANVLPHDGSNSKFIVQVHAPSQQDLVRNQQGYRKLVDTANAVKGLPAMDDTMWNTMGFKGQREAALNAMQFLSPDQPFTEQNLPAVLAQRRQQLAAYQNHIDLNGKSDADPAVVTALSKSVDFLQKAADDMSATRAKQAADTKKAESETPTGRLETQLKQTELEKTQEELRQMQSAGGTDPFGAEIGKTSSGTPLNRKEFDSAQKTFNKEYIQPLNVLAKTNMEFERINSNPNQSGAEKVTALLNAVGISGDPLKGKGFRISNDVINEHATARNIWESGIQKLNTIAGSGGPITSKQIADYTAVAHGVVHDAYLAAALEARRQGLPVDFLPRATRQKQQIDPFTAKIYLDVAGGNKESARKAATAAGYSF